MFENPLTVEEEKSIKKALRLKMFDELSHDEKVQALYAGVLAKRGQLPRFDGKVPPNYNLHIGSLVVSNEVDSLSSPFRLEFKIATAVTAIVLVGSIVAAAIVVKRL